jgi:hypothetical protein
MPRKANPLNEAESQRPSVDDLCVELVAFDGQLPVSDAELDALEQLLGAELRNIFSQ